MGITVTCVCAIAAYSSVLVDYNFLGSGGNFTYTAIVQGGNCSFIITGDNDPNGVIDIFNITQANQPVLENLHCTLNSTNGCQTNWQVFNDLPMEYVTFDFENYNISTKGLTDKQNWTYVSLPPVPQQPQILNFDPTNSTAFAVTSMYSSEYGSALIGCVLSATPSGTPWSYMGQDLPASLSSNSGSNSLPYLSSAQYGVSQAQTLTFPLSSLNLNASTLYDFAFVCYNGNGRSPANQKINLMTSSSLPTPQPRSNTAPLVKSSHSIGWAAALAGVIAVMAMAL